MGPAVVVHDNNYHTILVVGVVKSVAWMYMCMDDYDMRVDRQIGMHWYVLNVSDSVIILKGYIKPQEIYSIIFASYLEMVL